MIRALVFDFDGVILDTETALVEACKEIHRRSGIPCNSTQLLKEVGQASSSCNPWRHFPPSVDRRALNRRLSRLANQSIIQLPVMPGVLALVQAAKAQGLFIGIASNSSTARVESHLRSRGLISLFGVIAGRDAGCAPKPAPDLYRRVLRHFRLQGSEAVAFEDSETGVLAAKRAGLHVVAIPNASTFHHDFASADMRLPSLAGSELDTICGVVEALRT